MAGEVYIGTSGWSYEEWKDDFYRKVPRSRWLEHYGEQFGALEINATFYRLQSEGTLASWANRTPRDFVFCAKGHRYLTHMTGLKGAEAAVRRTRDNMQALGEKLRVVLWQFPASFQREMGVFGEFVEVLEREWSQVRHAVELRHPSWMDEEVAELLSEKRIGVCQADAPDFRLWDVVTTDFVYVRLHGHTRKYISSYRGELLEEWAEKLRGWRREGLDAYVFFDNTAEGAAPRDARRLREILDGEGGDQARQW